MKKATQKGLLKIILLLALCAFVLLNLLAQAAGARYQTKLDLTEEKLYALSDDTRAVATALSQDTAVIVFSAEAEYPAMLREMLARYAQLSPRLRVTYADPADNPVLMTHYRQMGVTLAAADLLVEGARRVRAVSYADMILTENGQPTGIDLEQQLTAALLYVNSDYAPRAVFTTGHGERPTAALSKLFTDNNFTVETLAIAVEDPQTPQLLVIAAPAYDFTAQDAAVLETCLAAGSRLMVFLEPAAPDALPVLQAFLRARGLAVQSNVVFEPKAYAAGSPHNIIPMYTSHAVNAYFADQAVYVVMPSASGITLTGVGGKAEALLRTTGDAYAKSDLGYTASQKAEGDAAGPFTVAALAGETVFLATSRLLYADDLMGMASYANRAFLAQVLGALWQESAALSLPPKMLASAPLAITGGQAQTLLWVLAGGLPLLALAGGLAVQVRRRRL